MASWYHHLFWKFLQITKAKRLCKTYNVEVISEIKEPKPPFLLFGNHAFMPDPYLLGRNIKFPINYMANVDAVSFFAKLGSKLVGIFPKLKGVPDINAVKIMFKLLKKKHAVGIFPEGDRSWDGETDEILKNITSIMKIAKIPVVLACITGNYLSGPRWAETTRQGKIFIEFKTLEKEEILKTGKKELYKGVCDFLYRNDIKDPRLKDVEFKGERLAEGVRFLLWLCPECNKHDSIKGKNNTILCTKCGAKWELNGNLKIAPKNKAGIDLKDWCDWQKKEIVRLCSEKKDSLITKTTGIDIYERVEKKVIFYCRGNLELYKDKIVFKADDNKKEELEFNIKEVLYYVDNFNDNFQFSYNEKRFKIKINGKNDWKWIYFLKHLQEAE